MAAEVTTTAGRVAGIGEGALSVYRGIPYAEPPIGRLRWQPPVPVTPWSGTRSARSFGAAGPQSDGPPSALPELDAGPADEDCLTLNVWAPTDAHDRPVLVWIHGGAFICGSSAITSYDGARLATENDVVVVSINYRLGALGFAPIAGTANLGLLDQLLALEWVRDNAEGFGGDPDLITVFGESAGGGSILHLLASPASEGLFRRAIVQSGATTLTLSSDQAADVADRVRFALGVDPATAPVAAILDAQARVSSELIPILGAMPFHPVVDLALVAGPPLRTVRSTVDLLIGTAANELNTYLDPAAPELEVERLRKRAQRYLPLYGVHDPEVVLAAYGNELRSASEIWAAMRTDAEMWVPAVAAAEGHGDRGGRTFMYRFDWPAAPPNRHLGACHAIDIPFTFGTFDCAGWDRFVGADDDAVSLGHALRESWATFAATGDPSTPRLAGWTAYSSESRPTMVLDRVPHLTWDPRAEVRKTWSAA